MSAGKFIFNQMPILLTQSIERLTEVGFDDYLADPEVALR